MLFRRTNRYGYSRYNGNAGNIMRVVKIILFVIAVLAVVTALVVWGMQRYVVYDAEGAHLRLPWQSSEPAGGDDSQLLGGSSSLAEPEVIVEDGSGSASGVQPEEAGSASEAAPEEGTADSDAEPEQDTPVTLEQLLAEHISKSRLKAGLAASDVKKAKGNAALVYLKESSGKLNFYTENELATTLGVSAALEADGSDATLKAIEDLQAQGYGVVAYVDCFRDKTLGAKKAYAILNTSGERWKDGSDIRWASPSNEDVQDYLTALVKELAEAGVDEIVLNNACYPTSGNVDKIAEDSDKTEVITAFYQKLAEALSDSDTILSVYSDETTITTGANDVSGQTLEAIKLLGGRIYVDGAADPAELQTALEEAGFDGSALCLVTDKLDEASALSQCIFD